jgi:hypothetical protein
MESEPFKGFAFIDTKNGTSWKFRIAKTVS